MLVCEFKVKGTTTQYQAIDEAILTSQFVRNKCLRFWLDNSSISRSELFRYNTALRAEFTFVKALNSHACQAGVERCWFAISRFFANCKKQVPGKKGFPRFKKHSRSVEYKTSGWQLSSCRKRISFLDGKQIGKLKLVGSRDLNFYQLEQIKRVRLIRRADGYYCQFLIQADYQVKAEPTHKEVNATPTLCAATLCPEVTEGRDSAADGTSGRDSACSARRKASWREPPRKLAGASGWSQPDCLQAALPVPGSEHCVAEDKADGVTVRNLLDFAVGLDLGLRYFLADSNGKVEEAPRFYRKAERKLSRANRKKSKKYCSYAKLQSKNYHKARVRYAQKHLRVSRQREEYCKRLAYSVIQSNDLVAYEDLNVKGLVRNRHRPQLCCLEATSRQACGRKSISDAGWATFRQWLEYFGEKYGRTTVAVAPHYTSQDCSKCGIVKKALSTRTHVCPHCKYEADRDTNAAINILQRGLTTVGHTGSYTLGEFSPLVALEQSCAVMAGR